MELWERYVLVRGSKCKGVWSIQRNKEAVVAAVEGVKGKGIGDEFKAISGFMIRVLGSLWRSGF